MVREILILVIFGTSTGFAAPFCLEKALLLVKTKNLEGSIAEFAKLKKVLSSEKDSAVEELLIQGKEKALERLRKELESPELNETHITDLSERLGDVPAHAHPAPSEETEFITATERISGSLIYQMEQRLPGRLNKHPIEIYSSPQMAAESILEQAKNRLNRSLFEKINRGKLEDMMRETRLSETELWENSETLESLALDPAKNKKMLSLISKDIEQRGKALNKILKKLDSVGSLIQSEGMANATAIQALTGIAGSGFGHLVSSPHLFWAGVAVAVASPFTYYGLPIVLRMYHRYLSDQLRKLEILQKRQLPAYFELGQ